ncbi:outer membrane protein [Herbaspirillum sp. Sphag1AN]|uniref:OmpH family outer membrane protein n=1 Tax=unclassified Herbaspirillum TaxID=2624150 RepID=UPI001828BDDF|nr:MULTISPECIES: OmpH family outer membrane protein [unclassified Herbaspirillum]MBB3211944.1 outer membrane protein [Herbaspirillum sp. Sphag1AN]MBB3244222.1 outer membrane protein [Herbaspirillum sp. Sphag64]
MKFITKSLLSIQAATLAVGLLAFANVHAQESSKIAFVSTERIFREAAPAKAAQAKLEQEFSKREKDLADMGARLKAQSEKLDKDAPVLSDADRAKRQRDLSDLDKEFQRKQREFREDLNQRRNEELAVVLERTNGVIRKIADAEKYDIVFQEAVYASKRIDITDKVLKELAK